MEPVVFEVADGVTAIDTFMGGRERYTAGYLLDADDPTLIETGPTTSVEPVTAALTRLGIDPDSLAHIVVTHIHLDHAGGVGRLSGPRSWSPARPACTASARCRRCSDRSIPCRPAVSGGSPTAT
jgi:glyoxylase-like metal-dependent hydrolase (beta-lactamase superfamily II)